MFAEPSFWSGMERLGSAYGVFFILLMLLSAGGIGLFFWSGWWVTNREGSRSPITRGQLAPGDLITYDTVQKIQRFMLSQPQPENAPFEVAQAAICRDSGKIFTEARNAFDVLRVGNDFPRRRWPGHWVQWKHLHSNEQRRLASLHECVRDLKRDDLYGDPIKGSIMSWQRVPETEVEVLVVMLTPTEKKTQ